MGVAEDLRVMEEQERVLRFAGFDADTAWRLGGVLRGKLVALGAAGTVEIELAGQVLFTAVTVDAGTGLAGSPGQADWVRRKRNTVRRFARSSYAVGKMLERDGQTMAERHGLELKDYAAHGGGFPLAVVGVGIIGSVVVSGLAQREDHRLAVEGLAEVMGVQVAALE